ncbi:hypothetical protein JK621_19940 [Serratia plymuthica]|uniref:hypothetical protein n=1 Tax=Serratia plymuthica TaxID=82996 RepID=UPI001BB0B236|nr:hypothetical protein [Serratia plymuthica]QUY47651.1 hypothetical protein JK621_19940 [Serratia plymuthica]
MFFVREQPGIVAFIPFCVGFSINATFEQHSILRGKLADLGLTPLNHLALFSKLIFPASEFSGRGLMVTGMADGIGQRTIGWD